MLEKLLLKEAERRREVFRNLTKHLRDLSLLLKRMDEESRIFLFGSLARWDHVLISEVDVLIKTNLKPKEVIAKLRGEGFDEPFEFHIVDEREFEIYKGLIPELKEI
ncbi:MAG: nucleotidyltransferase domain-containing protein [Candidatus Bathyarchaeia archaeon]